MPSGARPAQPLSVDDRAPAPSGAGAFSCARVVARFVRGWAVVRLSVVGRGGCRGRLWVVGGGAGRIGCGAAGLWMGVRLLCRIGYRAAGRAQDVGRAGVPGRAVEAVARAGRLRVWTGGGPMLIVRAGPSCAPKRLCRARGPTVDEKRRGVVASPSVFDLPVNLVCLVCLVCPISPACLVRPVVYPVCPVGSIRLAGSYSIDRWSLFHSPAASG